MKKNIIVLFIAIFTFGLAPAQIKVILVQDYEQMKANASQHTSSSKSRIANRKINNANSSEILVGNQQNNTKKINAEDDTEVTDDAANLDENTVNTESKKEVKSAEKVANGGSNIEKIADKKSSNSNADYVKRLRERQKAARRGLKPGKETSSVMLEDDTKLFEKEAFAETNSKQMIMPMVMVGEAKYKTDLSTLAVSRDQLNYMLPDRKAQFPKGDKELTQYFLRGVNYPAELKGKNLEDDLTLRFVVDKNGKAGKGEILRADTSVFSNEVLRVLNTLPTFTPALFKGQPVDTNIEMDISFKLLKL